MATHGEKRWPPVGRFRGRLWGAFHGRRQALEACRRRGGRAGLGAFPADASLSFRHIARVPRRLAPTPGHDRLAGMRLFPSPFGSG